MKNIAEVFIRYLTLTVLTVVACMVMWWVSGRGNALQSAGQAGTSPPPATALPKAVVALADIQPTICESVIKHSGKIQPWETYSLGFEIGGRVLQLGVDAQGQPLDDGATVSAGQVLARLDDRILRAQQSETVARLEQATSDLGRARKLRDRGGQAITESEYQEYLTQHALAKAQQQMATKNLEDSVLVSPVDGAISRRRVEAGESVNAHNIVFEIVENADVLLVVNVPEARVRELELRRRDVQQARRRSRVGDVESGVFRARVQMEGRDRYGHPWPAIDAEVYRIAQMADPATGLFEVEVRIPNSDGLLRPGMVASASIVTDRLLAYRIPEQAVIFRDGHAYVYTVTSESAPVKAMFWDVGQTELYRAERVDLQRYVDQGDFILVPATEAQLGPVVVRGQQRLAHGQMVRAAAAGPPQDNATATPLPFAADGGSNNPTTARRSPGSTRGEVN